LDNNLGESTPGESTLYTWRLYTTWRIPLHLETQQHLENPSITWRLNNTWRIQLKPSTLERTLHFGEKYF